MYKLGIQNLNNSFNVVLVDELNNIVSKSMSNNLDDALSNLIKNQNISIRNIYISTDFIYNKFKTIQNIDIKYNILILKITSFKLNEAPFNNYLLNGSKIKIIEYYIEGSIDFNGKEILPLNSKNLEDAIKFINSNEIHAIGILGEFSIYYSTQEEIVKEYIGKNISKKIPIFKSSEIPVSGFLNRELALIINILLTSDYLTYIKSIMDTLKNYNLNYDIYIINSFGSIISLEKSKNYPILLKDSFLASEINGAIDIIKIDNFYLLILNNNKIYITKANNFSPIVMIKKYKIFDHQINIPSIIIKEFNLNDKNNLEFYLSNLINQQNYLIINSESKDFINSLFFDKVLKLNLKDYLGAYGSTVSPYIKSLEYIESLKLKGRFETLENARLKCKKALLDEGVENSSIREVKVEEIPISYLTWDILKIKVTMKGFLKEQ